MSINNKLISFRRRPRRVTPYITPDGKMFILYREYRAYMTTYRREKLGNNAIKRIAKSLRANGMSEAKVRKFIAKSERDLRILLGLRDEGFRLAA